MHKSLWSQLKSVFDKKKKEQNNNTILTNDINDPQNKARSNANEASDFSQILKSQNVELGVSVSSENELLKYLSVFACKLYPELDKEKIYGKFLIREKKASTDLGDGIVLPHI